MKCFRLIQMLLIMNEYEFDFLCPARVCLIIGSTSCVIVYSVLVTYFTGDNIISSEVLVNVTRKCLTKAKCVQLHLLLGYTFFFK